ncbi:MAG: hypothetical protein COA52_11570 [Hyphomicrobiales bacterium]|nr:MAG: hypothetical protein COA52_11570 [Hyphomicrobiales bacterium]
MDESITNSAPDSDHDHVASAGFASVPLDPSYAPPVKHRAQECGGFGTIRPFITLTKYSLIENPYCIFTYSYYIINA